MNRHLFKEGELVISLSGRCSERSQPKVKGALYKVCQIKETARNQLNGFGLFFFNQ